MHSLVSKQRRSRIWIVSPKARNKPKYFLCSRLEVNNYDNSYENVETDEVFGLQRSSFGWTHEIHISTYRGMVNSMIAIIFTRADCSVKKKSLRGGRKQLHQTLWLRRKIQRAKSLSKQYKILYVFLFQKRRQRLG